MDWRELAGWIAYFEVKSQPAAAGNKKQKHEWEQFVENGKVIYDGN